MPPWRIEAPEGRQLAEIKQSSKFLREYQILAPDRSIIAEIHPIIKIPILPGGKYPSYRIDILRQGLDPFLILSLFPFASDYIY